MTAMKLSRCSIALFIALCVLSTSFVTITNFTPAVQSDERLFSLLSALTAIWYMSQIIVLSVLFASKLLKVYRNSLGSRVEGTNSPKSRNLLQTITRLSVLNFVSLHISLMAAGAGALFFSEHIWTEFGAHFLVQMDIFTNFVCVLLSDGKYQKYYSILCGCCDRKCRWCCRRMVGDKEKEKPLNEKPPIQKVVSTTATNGGTTETQNVTNNTAGSIELHVQSSNSTGNT